jgi:hypothetical protein
MQHIGTVNTVIWVTQTRLISKPGILPYPEFSICRVLHRPPPVLPCTSWPLLIRLVLALKESIPFDPSGNPVPPVFLQLPLIFFNQHSRCGFYPLSRVVGLDHPVAQFIGNDHVLALGHLSLICVHQRLLVHELHHADGE